MLEHKEGSQKIYLANKYCIVDTIDAAYLCQFKWYSSKLHSYPYRYINKYGEQPIIISLSDDILARVLDKKVLDANEYSMLIVFKKDNPDFTRDNIKYLIIGNYPYGKKERTYFNPTHKENKIKESLTEYKPVSGIATGRATSDTYKTMSRGTLASYK